MVAINSIPQQEVANGKGHNEWERARPITLSKEVAKKTRSFYAWRRVYYIDVTHDTKRKRFIPLKNEPQIYNFLKANELS